MSTPAMQQVLDALAAALGGISGITFINADPAGAGVYPAMYLAPGGQERVDEETGQTDWELRAYVTLLDDDVDAATLAARTAVLFAKLVAAVEAVPPTLGGTCRRAWVEGHDDPEIGPLASDSGDVVTPPLAVTQCTVRMDYAHVEGDPYTLI
ncbi:MAG: hypothetical protein RIB84_23890 [Sneathiellaceae bacterium]